MTPYHQRMQRALDHIEQSPDRDQTLDELSAIAAFSKYHFVRQFTALFGLAPHRYRQLLRLKRAAYQLAFRQESVLSIALECGYEGPEAFARAFRQLTQKTPSAFRRAPDWTCWQSTLQPISQTRALHMRNDFQPTQVSVRTVPTTRVAVLEHRGDPAQIGQSLRTFIAWRKAVNLPPRISATYNIFYDDPNTTPAEAFRLDLCAATDRPFTAEALNGLVIKHIPAGRCAVLRLVGPDQGLEAGFTYLYGTWLPQSGEELRDFPPYCQRVTFFPDVPEAEAVTDLFLPLAG